MTVTAERIGERMLQPAPATGRFFVITALVAVVLMRFHLVGHNAEVTALRTNDLIAIGSQ